MQDYKSPRAAVMICAPWLTCRQTPFRPADMNSWANWSKNQPLIFDINLVVYLAAWFKLTVTEMTINGNKANPLTVTVTEKFQ